MYDPESYDTIVTRKEFCLLCDETQADRKLNGSERNEREGGYSHENEEAAL